MATWYEQLRRILVTAGAISGRAGSLVFARFASATVLDGVATVTIGAPTYSTTIATTNATPADWTIPVNTTGGVTVLAYRVIGKVDSTADGGAIIREGSKAVTSDDTGVLGALKVGGTGTETFGELGDTGVLYRTDAASLAAANIDWISTHGAGVILRVTGVAATNITWTLEAWVREY